MASDNRFEQLEKFRQDVESCIECGTCTIWCPIYQARPVEVCVARGKNQTIRALLSGDAGYTKEFADVLGTCTLCMACTEHCPVKSEVPATIVAARADQCRTQGIGFPFNIVYRWLVPRRRLLRSVVKAASWLQRLSILASFSGMGGRIPAIAPTFLRGMIPVIHRPPRGVETTMRVGYFVG
jgi:Fe-S oxidoreductase